MVEWMKRRGRDDYLFASGDLGEALRQFQIGAVQAVDGLSEQKFKQLSDAQVASEILSKFKIMPIELLEDQKSMTRSEIKIDVSGDRNRNVFGDRGPILVNGIRVVISIPFQGDPELWKLKPSTWRTTFPRGKVQSKSGVGGGTLAIELQCPADEGPERLKQDLDRTLDDIRFYLQNQRQQIGENYPQLPAKLAGAITARRGRIAKHDSLSDLLGIPMREDTSVGIVQPSKRTQSAPAEIASRAPDTAARWDVFISHASEDKEEFVRALADRLRGDGLSVWYDEFSLTVGDSLRRSIDKGLANSQYGIVVISESFLKKEWPQKELDGLVAREVSGEKVILPVWHNVGREIVTRYSPTLADRLASNSAKGLDAVVSDIKQAIERGRR